MSFIRYFLDSTHRKASLTLTRFAALAGCNLVSPVMDLFGVAGRANLAEVMKKELRPAADR